MPFGAYRLNSISKVLKKPSIAKIYGGGYVSQYGRFGRSYYNPTLSAGITIDQSTDYQFSSGQDFTVEGWIWFGGTASNKYLFDGRPDSNSLAILCDGTWLKVYIAGAYRITSPSQDMSPNQWYHIAYSRSGSTGRLFRNGVLMGSWSDTVSYTHNNTLKIATRYVAGQGASDTYVDEFRISRVARYTSNFTPSTTGFTGDANTVLLLHMDEPQGSTVIYDTRNQAYTGSSGNNPPNT